MEASNLKETLTAIELSIADRRKEIECGKDIESLLKDDRFNRVIMSGYLEVRAKLLFDTLLNPAMEVAMDKVGLQVEAIKELKRYILGIQELAKQAPNKILKEEIYRKEITAEAARESI